MQNLKSLIFPILTLFLLASCNSSQTPTENPLLKDANKLHLEAMEVEKAFKPLLEQLVNQRNGIQVQGRALTDEEIQFSENVDKLQGKFIQWEENRVEVPGFEHAHDHSGHDHHHHHNDVKLTSEQMLDVQKLSLVEIKKLKIEAENLLK